MRKLVGVLRQRLIGKVPISRWTTEAHRRTGMKSCGRFGIYTACREAQSRPRHSAGKSGYDSRTFATLSLSQPRISLDAGSSHKSKALDEAIRKAPESPESSFRFCQGCFTLTRDRSDGKVRPGSSRGQIQLNYSTLHPSLPLTVLHLTSLPRHLY